MRAFLTEIGAIWLLKIPLYSRTRDHRHNLLACAILFLSMLYLTNIYRTFSPFSSADRTLPFSFVSLSLSRSYLRIRIYFNPNTSTCSLKEEKLVGICEIVHVTHEAIYMQRIQRRKIENNSYVFLGTSKSRESTFDPISGLKMLIFCLSRHQRSVYFSNTPKREWKNNEGAFERICTLRLCCETIFLSFFNIVSFYMMKWQDYSLFMIIY